MKEPLSNNEFLPLNLALLTVSDTRHSTEDASGALLREQALLAGHRVLAQELIRDDVYHMRALFSHWIAAPQVQVIISTGGTGITGRDGTPEAVLPLLDKTLEGFGELFRQLSYQELGPAALQSRAIGGVANGTLIFCLPGSRGACRTAWEYLLKPQLDRRTRPCNFAQLLPRLLES